MTKPEIKKLRGSYFPKLAANNSSGFYCVEDVAGNLLYYGRSSAVARLINACLTPRHSH